MPNLPISIIGSHDDIYNRLVTALPPWFGIDHPVEDYVLEGYINVAQFIYELLVYDHLQMRLQTATGDNLDLISKDYLGSEVPRKTKESDRSYRNRIKALLLQPRATRPAMQNALFLLTGIEPIIYEPWNAADNGGYNVITPYVSLAYADPSDPTTGTGHYGSGSYPYQCFIDVFVNGYELMGGYSGYNNYFGGYSTVDPGAFLWYGGESLIKDDVEDRDIYQTINLTKCEGTICWVAIHRILTSF